MGLFDHLFKPKPEAAGEKGGEAAAGHPEGVAKLGESDASPADPSTFLRPKGYGAGAAEDPVAPVQPAGVRPMEKKSGAAPSQNEPAGEVVLTLNEILPRIPTHYLRTGMHDLRRELRFDINALSSDIARGRASVPLSIIARLCPEIFHSPIGPLEDLDIRLPLQKLVEQIGSIRADTRGQGQGLETANAEAHKVAGSDDSRPTETPVEAAPDSPPKNVESALRDAVAGPYEAGGAGGLPPGSETRATAEPPAIHFTAREGVSVPLPIEDSHQTLPNGEARTAPAPPAAESSSEAQLAPVFTEAFSATTESQIVVPSALENAPTNEDASAPSAEAEPAPISRTAGPDVAAAMSAVPATEPPPASPSPVGASAETAPAGGFVPSMHLPPVRLFAPPPPIFAKAASAATDTAVTAGIPDAASPASPRSDATPSSAESELLRAVEPAPSQNVPAPTPEPDPERVAASVPAFPAPIHLKSEAPAETPPPILRSANPNPAPVPAGRPLILPPPLHFGQRAPEPSIPAASPPPVAPSSDASELKPPLAQGLPAAAPASEATVAPARPLPSFGQDNIQALFMTEEVLDLHKISRLAAELPGVQACVIATRETAVTGGLLPEGFDVTALLGLAPRVGEAAGRLPIGALKHFTLYGEHYSVSFFERSGLCLCAVHRARSFVPGVREKLVALADELAL